MNFKNQLLFCWTIIFLLGLTIFYQLSKPTTGKTKPYIICTTSIIADALKNIARDKVELVTLMGPGIDPHLYKPVESDIFKISSADIIFYNGLHLEAKLVHLFEHLAQTQTTIAVTKNIPQSKLLRVSDFENIFDPHIWFDIHLWIIVVETICQELIKKYPEDTIFYKKNMEQYKKELHKLQQQTHAIMSTIPANKRVIITGHDAFSYFARQHDCSVIGLQGISTESSPGAYDLQKIISIICKQNIPAIFIETSIPIKNILAIQEGVAAYNKQVNLGGEIYSDALGPENSPGDTYIKMMLHNTQTIALALTC
ncbi:zinc ABC transporter substrate-binding protein [Candidatus Babeliales bacterium]|nr:zinc ABC transporter substrate-binding protein [Candidatus Babeliales bacterium]MBP9844215.1 zinc ABC transporter substrate-binding protein [Candidatus Babeliales bacterium]